MIEKLASSLGQKEQSINIALAKELADDENINGIKEIAENLTISHKAIAGDCIKVMYEIGYIKPMLITEYLDVFIDLLSSKNNRMVWGSMISLAQIASIKQEEINKHFDRILQAYEKGSVITIDNCITVFAEITKADLANSELAYNTIINHLKTCRAKEVPQHGEKAFICINNQNADEFRLVLEKRMNELSLNQQKRIHKILKNIDTERYI